jgi:serine/threonine protein kinase
MISNNNIKLIDFGFATNFEENRKIAVYCGTPNYMSPEMVNKVINYHNKH